MFLNEVYHFVQRQRKPTIISTSSRIMQLISLAPAPTRAFADIETLGPICLQSYMISYILFLKQIPLLKALSTSLSVNNNHQLSMIHHNLTKNSYMKQTLPLKQDAPWQMDGYTHRQQQWQFFCHLLRLKDVERYGGTEKDITQSISKTSYSR